MATATAFSKNVLFSALDDLLDAIGIKLQISKSAHEGARDRYITIAKWLRAEGSPLAKYKPHIFSQGSLRIRTTVKPKGGDQYDLDLVCLLEAKPESFSNAVEVLDLIQERLETNKTYEGMIERKNRCIRINYANEFHLDILPACPNPIDCEDHGEHCLKVPDSNLEDWKDSNPKGYANWFEGKAQTAAVSFRKGVEPLPEQQAYEELEVLNRVVQLMKRHRDVALEELEIKERPISIVLTTLAARYYNGSPSVIDALENVLLQIKNHIEAEAANGNRIVVLNPTNSNEDLSERWDNDPKLYTTFKDWINKFIELLESLRKQPGLPEVAKQLKEMFGENVINDVVKDYTKRVSEERSAGNLATAFTTGLIVPRETPKSTSVEPNTHHGDFDV